MGGFRWGDVGGAFTQLALVEQGAGADERDELGRVDPAPARVDNTCRYGCGSTSLTCGERRHQAGRITEENRCRPAVSGSVCLSSTRGARTVTAPDMVKTLGLLGHPGRYSFPFIHRF